MKMENVGDFLEAIKEMCDVKNDYYFDLEFEDKRMRVYCNGNDLYAEIIPKFSIMSMPINNDLLKKMLEDGDVKYNSADTDNKIQSRVKSIKRVRIIDQILNSPDLPFPEEQ